MSINGEGATQKQPEQLVCLSLFLVLVACWVALTNGAVASRGGGSNEQSLISNATAFAYGLGFVRNAMGVVFVTT